MCSYGNIAPVGGSESFHVILPYAVCNNRKNVPGVYIQVEKKGNH